MAATDPILSNNFQVTIPGQPGLTQCIKRVTIDFIAKTFTWTIIETQDLRVTTLLKTKPSNFPFNVIIVDANNVATTVFAITGAAVAGVDPLTLDLTYPGQLGYTVNGTFTAFT